MAEIKVWRLFVTPRTHVRTTMNERWLMATDITDERLIEIGTKKYNERVEKNKSRSKDNQVSVGSPNAYLSRRNTIKRYFDYKRDLYEEAKKKKFEIPPNGAWFKFYIPMPKSWSKKKKRELCFEPCPSKPDCDNLCKGLFDALLPKRDELITDYRASKFWYDGPGHIEITLGELTPAIGYTKYIFEDNLK